VFGPFNASGDRWSVRHSLVAAGVFLRGNQHQARALRFWLKLDLWTAAERGQDAEDDRISGENAESDGRDDGDEQNHGHKERNHDLGSFYLQSVLNCVPVSLIAKASLVVSP